jgi:hypothetical protein
MAVGILFHFHTENDGRIMMSWRNVAEEALNCWLSYTMSQPVQFDLAVLCLFALQYLGVREIMKLVKELILSFDQHHKLMKPHSFGKL